MKHKEKTMKNEMRKKKEKNRVEITKPQGRTWLKKPKFSSKERSKWSPLKFYQDNLQAQIDKPIHAHDKLGDQMNLGFPT